MQNAGMMVAKDGCRVSIRSRPTVTLAARMLKKAGPIEYGRGSVKILDRKGLESATRGCYKVIKNEFGRPQG